MCHESLLSPGGPGKTRSADDFVSLLEDLEQRVFGPLPDETWSTRATATTPPSARSARSSRSGASAAGDPTDRRAQRVHP